MNPKGWTDEHTTQVMRVLGLGLVAGLLLALVLVPSQPNKPEPKDEAPPAPKDETPPEPKDETPPEGEA